MPTRKNSGAEISDTIRIAFWALTVRPPSNVANPYASRRPITSAEENSTAKITKRPARGKPGARSFMAISLSLLLCRGTSLLLLRRLRPLVGEPLAEVRLGQHVRGLAHRGVPDPAQLRAHDRVVPDPRRVHAVAGVDPRHRVDLLAERGHPEVVDHVLGLD